MKHYLVAAAFALAAVTATAAHAEGRLRDSDDWNCNHGAPGAAVTAQACERLRNGSSADEEAWAAQQGQGAIAATAPGCPPATITRREHPAG
ncbi:MAG TPA: hypothetical protein VGL58_14105 [Caulobacteraceae bacterium]